MPLRSFQGAENPKGRHTLGATGHQPEQPTSNIVKNGGMGEKEF